jgi:hypothetical protein
MSSGLPWSRVALTDWGAQQEPPRQEVLGQHSRLLAQLWPAPVQAAQVPCEQIPEQHWVEEVQVVASS